MNSLPIMLHGGYGVKTNYPLHSPHNHHRQTDMSNTMIDALEASAKWSALTLSEQIAARAIARRLVAMATDGASAEDWQQLAGCAEWAQHAGALKAAKPTLTIAGQWIERRRLDAMLPHSSTARVETRYRNGLGGVGNASSFNWAMTGGERDIIAFRYVD